MQKDGTLGVIIDSQDFEAAAPVASQLERYGMAVFKSEDPASTYHRLKHSLRRGRVYGYKAATRPTAYQDATSLVLGEVAKLTAPTRLLFESIWSSVGVEVLAKPLKLDAAMLVLDAAERLAQMPAKRLLASNLTAAGGGEAKVLATASAKLTMRRGEAPPGARMKPSKVRRGDEAIALGKRAGILTEAGELSPSYKLGLDGE